MSLILTKAGLDAYAQSEATGTKLQATHMAIGDGGGAAVAHTDTSEALINETWRGELQDIKVAASGEVEFQGHVPITVGGWYIREVAIYADDTLLALSSHPETWKPAPESPDKVELVITAPVKFANAEIISLTVDTTKVLASQEHVAEAITTHNEAPGAHPDLVTGLASDIADHNADPNAHQPLFDKLTATIRGLRKQVVIDKMMAGAADTGYIDGFIKDFSESSDVVEAESSGYVHDVAEGVFRSIDPATDGGAVVVDWTVADVENVQGAITTLTVDAANTSGHFDAPVNSRVVEGVRVVSDGGEVGILSISGDGTAANSVALIGAIAAGNHAVQGIHGQTIDGGKLLINSYDMGYSQVEVTVGMLSYSGFTYHAPNLDQLIDGATTTITGYGGYNLDGTAAAIIEYDFGTPREIVKFSDWTVTGPCTDIYNIEYYDESDSQWKSVGSQGPFPSTGEHALTWTSVGAHQKWRMRQTGGAGGNYHSEHQWFVANNYAPAGNYYTALASLPGEAWTAIQSIVVTDDKAGAYVYYALRFSNEYRVYKNSEWRAIARNTSGIWQCRDNADAWADAEENNAQCAVSSAMGAANNRMIGSALAGLTDASFGGVYPSGISATMHTTDKTSIPSADTATFDVAVADMPLTLVVQPQDTISLPDDSPASLLAAFGIIPIVPVDPAVDISLKVSDDDGATYAPVTIDGAVQFVTGQYLISGVGDVSGQSGTKPKIKITAAAGKHLKIDAGGCFWS